MPNLVGVIDPHAEREALSRALGRMLAAVDLPGFQFERRTVLGSGVVVGNLLPGVERNLDQPARDADRGLWLMLDGEIWNSDELARDLARREIQWSGGDANLALAAFQAFGLDFLERLNGQWNLVLHDTQRGETLLASDLLGSRILYTAHDGNRFTFASEAKGVIAGREVETRAGGSGLLQLLSSAGHFGSWTWLEGISLLDPGTLLRFSAQGVTRRRYTKLRFNEGAPAASEDDYAAGFAHRLRVATERAMKDHATLPIAITLSGGLDSRSVALSIDPRHLPIPSLTYGDPDSADVRYAAELARVIGLDHHYVEEQRAELERASAERLDSILGPSPAGRRGFYACQVDRVAWRSEGMTSFTGLTSAIWHPLFAKHMRVMLNGAVGDALTGSHLTPQLLLEPTRAQVIDRFRRAFYFQDPRLVQRVLTPRFWSTWESSLEPAFAHAFEEIDADEALAIASVWDLENRQRRGSFSSFTMERHFCLPRAPYLDHDLALFLASIPGRWRFQQRIYKKMLVHHHPAARHVPWAATGRPIHDGPLYELLREATSFGLRRLERSLPWTPPSTKPRWAFRDVERLIREDKDLGLSIDRWAASSRFPGDVFDRAGLRSFLEDYRAGKLGSQGTLLHNHLVILSRLHPWWLEGGVTPIPREASPAEFGVGDPSPPRRKSEAPLASP